MPEAVYGNEHVWKLFEIDKPLAAILSGPSGVGKWTGASLAAEALTIPEGIVRYKDVSVKDMHELAEWLQYRSSFKKVAIVEPGDCHKNVWPILKCLIEDTEHHVWLVGQDFPSSIRDLCSEYRLSLLSREELKKFFRKIELISVDEEYLFSLGSVEKALAMHKALNVKAAVANWIRAVEESNRDLLLTATQTWEPRHTELLVAELQKQLVGKTVIEAIQLQRVSRDKILNALTLFGAPEANLVTALGIGLSLMPR